MNVPAESGTSIVTIGRWALCAGTAGLLASLCFSIAMAHICMAVALIGWICSRPAIWRLPGFWWCVAFAAWVFGGSVVLWATQDKELIHSRHGTAFIWLAAYFAAVGLAEARVRRWALIAALVTMSASLIVAAAQFFIGLGIKSPFRIDPNGPRFDSSGGFFGKHLTQGFMMTLLCLAYLGQASLAGLPARWVWLGRGLATVAVLLANSRSGLLAFAASVGAHLVAGYGFRLRIMAGALAVLLAVVGWVWFVTPDKITRVINMQDGRLIHWEASLVMIPRHPVIGVGNRDGFKEENAKIVRELYPDGSQDLWLNAPHAHNIYLGLATEHGIPALLLYVAMVTAVMRHLYRRRAENLAGWQIGCGAVAAMMVGGMTEHYAGISMTSYGFFCLLGLAMALDRRYLEEVGVVEKEVVDLVLPPPPPNS